MRKANVIVVMAAVVMLAAMTGIAAAESLKILHPATGTEVSSVSLAPGSTITYDLEVGPFLNNPTVLHTLTNQVHVNVNPGAALASDISVEYQEQSPPGLWNPAPYQWTQETAADTYETLKVNLALAPNAPNGADYTIVIIDAATGERFEFAVASMGANSIPEFATIALPVGAILGLLFLFNHRKRRKE